MDEKLEVRKILLRLANDFEKRALEYATFTGENAEETAWLGRRFAILASEGSVAASDPGSSPGFKFTPAGYATYLPQIAAWRASASTTLDDPPLAPHLQVSLLYGMMRELGRLRALPEGRISTNTFEGLIVKTGRLARFDEWPRHLNRHLEFLEQSGFITVKSKLGDEAWAGIRLTLSGQKFVQPELADFGREPLLPEVVRSIEEQIHGLTQPAEEKETLLFKLRTAIAKQAPDLIVKFLVELASKILSRPA